MKNFLKWVAVFFGSIFLLFIISGILLYFFLPLDQIKSFAEKELSKQLNRKVEIKSVSFNIFSGIKLKNVKIGNSKNFSKTPFIKAETLELKYAFWPIFQGKIIIPEINFVKPEILVEKGFSGSYNFSDMFAAEKNKKEKPKAKKSKGPQISLIVNTLKVSKGKITYHDYYTGKSGLNDLNIKISNITLAALKPIEISASAAANYMGKEIPISLSGKVKADISKNIYIAEGFSLKIAGENLNISSKISLQKSTNISVSFSSDKINVDPFLAMFGAQEPQQKNKKSVHGALTKSLKKTMSSIPKDLYVSADFALKKVSLKTLKLDNFDSSFILKGQKAEVKIKDFSAYKGKLFGEIFLDLASLSYSINKLELKDFSATPFINDMVDSFIPNLFEMKNNIEGVLSTSVSLKGSGVEMPEAFDNLKASGIILLSKGRIKKIKSLSAIGEKYNINTLKQDMIVSGLRINSSIQNKKLFVEKLALQDTDLQVDFSGILDFNKMEYVSGNRLKLTFSPNATKDLPSEVSIFKDPNGFLSLVFELQGSLYKPFPSPIFKNVIDAAVGNLKVKIEAKKIEIEAKAKAEVQKAATSLESQAKKQLEEEAKKKIKEILKF